MTGTFLKLFRARDLIRSWTGRTIRARYQQSALGWLWAVIQPVASVLIFSFVFTMVVPVPTDGMPYIIFSYVAMVPWTFFTSALTDMTESLVHNMSLVTKIYFPREAIPLSMLIARFFDFLIAAVLLVVLLLVYQVSVDPLLALFIPVVLLIQVVLTLGLGLAGAAVYVFFRDVQPLLKLFLQLLFYACPIIYPVSLVPENLRQLYFLNPVAGIIQAYRDLILNRTMPGDYLIPAAVMSVGIFVFGYWLFKRIEFLFADIV